MATLTTSGLRTLRFAQPCVECSKQWQAGEQAVLYRNGKLWEVRCPEHAEASPATEQPTEQPTEIEVLAEELARDDVAEMADTLRQNASGTPRRAGTNDCPVCASSWSSKRSLGQHLRHQHGGWGGATFDKARIGLVGSGIIDAVNQINGQAQAPAAEAAQCVAEVTAASGVNGVGDLSTKFFNANGRRVYGHVKKGLEAGLVVGMVGPSGTGKSTIAHLVAQQPPWNGAYDSIGCHDGMDIESIVGSNWPSNDAGKLTVWRDGALTASLRAGGIFHIEELANAPSEILSRCHQFMDEGSLRYASLPESEERRVAIHPNARIIASWNPPNKGYASTRITKPIMSRFGIIVDVSKPIVREKDLARLFVDDDTANRIMRLVVDMRGSEETYISTRDVKLFAQVIASGISPIDAVKLSLLPKVSGNTVGVIGWAKASFDMTTTVGEISEMEDEDDPR
jgi:MoxR-like ATPase